jgi:hypothetical protein
MLAINVSFFDVQPHTKIIINKTPVVLKFKYFIIIANVKKQKLLIELLLNKFDSIL